MKSFIFVIIALISSAQSAFAQSDESANDANKAPKISVHKKSENSEATCGWCHEAMPDKKLITTCPHKDATPMHTSCAIEYGRCSSCEGGVNVKPRAIKELTKAELRTLEKEASELIQTTAAEVRGHNEEIEKLKAIKFLPKDQRPTIEALDAEIARHESEKSALEQNLWEQLKSHSKQIANVNEKLGKRKLAQRIKDTWMLSALPAFGLGGYAGMAFLGWYLTFLQKPSPGVVGIPVIFAVFSGVIAALLYGEWGEIIENSVKPESILARLKEDFASELKKKHTPNKNSENVLRRLPSSVTEYFASRDLREVINPVNLDAKNRDAKDIREAHIHKRDPKKDIEHRSNKAR